MSAGAASSAAACNVLATPAEVVLSDRSGLLPPDTVSDVTATYAVCAAFLTRRSPSYRVSIVEPTACSTKS